MPVSNTIAVQAEKDRAAAYAQVARLRTAITENKRIGNQAGVDALLPLWRDWMAKLNAANVKLGSPEANLSALERAMLGTGTYIENVMDAFPDAAAAIPNALAKGLTKAALPYLALFGAYLYFRKKF